MKQMKGLNKASAVWRWLGVCALAFAVAACGGSGDAGDVDTGGPEVPEQEVAPPDPAPEPEQQPDAEAALGDLLKVTELQRFGSAQIAAALQADGSKLPGLSPRYDVATYRLRYLTEDQDGNWLPASGLVAVPLKGLGSAPGPLISYQHATIFYNDEAPSLRLEAGEPPMVLASLGYIVVASDYVGFGDSQGEDHPYLQSRPTARAVLDMLAAAQQWQLEQGVHDNGQLFLLGYSEGGYATMAVQREMERSRHPLLPQLVASVPGSGPYDMQATLDGLLSQIRGDFPVTGSLLKPGTLRHLNSKLRAEVRRALMRELVPGDTDVVYSPRVLDLYMGDKRDELQEQASVHWDWAPSAPVYLFHGRDDQTVPFAASESALDRLQSSGGAPVGLYECTSVQPAGHTSCVPEYFAHVLQVLTAHGAVP